LERETARNVEMMWLTGRLTPDFKTIADFRKDNGPAIRSACRQFVALCRSLNLFAHAIVAIDGSRFKAVNSRDRSFSRGSIKRRMEQVEASIERYLSALETADRQEGEVAEAKSARLKDKIAALRERMRKYKALEVAVHAAPDKQISLTDPDARSMATSGKDTGLVGYNVQAVVDTQHHLIVAHEVTNIGNDRSQLSTMAKQAQEATGVRELTAIADRGYFKGEEILACEATGVTPLVPKPLTSGAKADGRFGKQDFVYDAGEDVYRCPAGEKLTWRYSNVEAGRKLHNYWTTKCNLHAETEVHACKGAARQALGARSCPRRDAGAVRPCAQDHAHPTPDRRTSIRNHQGVDGRDPLQAAHPRKGQRGDEPSRSRLQSEADNRHLRGAAAHPGDEGRLSPSPYENLNRQQTQPRFRAVPA
jgi:transposase